MWPLALFFIAASLESGDAAAALLSDSLIPPAAQVVYHAIEQTSYAFNAPKGYHDAELFRMIDTRAKKELTPTQKQLLALHTALIREAKLQGLAKFQGYSEEVLSLLKKTNAMKASEQMKTLLQEALSRGHIKRGDTKEAAETVVAALNNPDSDLCKLMVNFTTLQYT